MVRPMNTRNPRALARAIPASIGRAGAGPRLLNGTLGLYAAKYSELSGYGSPGGGCRGLALGAGGRMSAGGLGRGQIDARMGPRTGESDRVPAAVGRDADREAGGVRLDHLPAADYQADVTGRGDGAVGSGEEDKVAWLHLTGADPWPPGPLLLRGARDIDARSPVGRHDQARAVEGIRAGPAPLIGLSQLI